MDTLVFFPLFSVVKFLELNLSWVKKYLLFDFEAYCQIVLWKVCSDNFHCHQQYMKQPL